MTADDLIPNDAGEAEALDRIGLVIGGRWRLERMIGVGGMAAVYASSDRSGRQGAVKILYSQYSTNETLKRRFLREAQVTAAVEHPGRVEIFDEGTSEQGDPYFVMELLEGTTLNDLWKQYDKKLPADYALSIADRVLDLLAACHEKGIVHRDLKPSNVFITSDGFVKVLDFGVARMRQAGVDPTMVGTALGTPSYMAPEQALGSHEGIDARTDLFAVGAVLHAVITGKRLHEGRSQQEAFVLAATRPPPSVARVDPSLRPDLVALIDRALQWDKRNRFPDARAMREEIARVLVAMKGQSAHERMAVPAGRANLLVALASADDKPQQSAPEADPELIAELKELFVKIERALTGVRQYGWEHPMTAGPIGQLHTACSVLLERIPDAIEWEVRPHSFYSRGYIVWEPVHPYDHIPYNLFASGFRNFAIQRGVTFDELRSLLDLLRRDPVRDFAPEDDLATAFWEKQLSHVSYRVVSSFLTAGARDAGDNRDREYDGLLEAAHDAIADRAAQDASRLDAPMSLEARAAAIAARAAALRAVRASGALALSDQQRADLGKLLDLPDSEWQARYLDVLADAACVAFTQQRLELLTVPLRIGVHDAIASGDPTHVLELIANVCLLVRPMRDAPTTRELVSGVFDVPTLAALLKHLARPGQHATDAVSVERLARALEALLSELSAEHFEAVLGAVARIEVDALKPPLFSYLERHATGNENRLGELLLDTDLLRARTILSILSRIDSEGARLALRKAERSPSPELRVEAVALRAAASAEGLRDELARLSTDADPAVRAAALRTMARHKVKEAGPPLVQHIHSAAFHKLPLDERRLALATLHELSPARAELVAVELIEKAALLGRESVDETRILAMELLERTATRRESLAVLDKTSGKWSNSTSVRAAASRAAAVIRTRLEPGR